MKNCLIVLLLLMGKVAHAQVSDFGPIDFSRADSIADHYEGENLKNLPLLAHKLTAALDSPVEQFRSIYTWVCKNISNDYADYLKNRKMRRKLAKDSVALANWNAAFRADMFQKLLKKRETVCTGYAYLIRELSELAGIPCKIIDGYGRTVESNIGGLGVPNHSWNAVKLNNRWYLCDPTWSSGYTLIPDFTYVHEYNDGYFLADPALFSGNHFPLDKTWLLFDNPPDLTEFLSAPIIYKYAFDLQMKPVKPSSMKVYIMEDEDLCLVFNAPDTLDIQPIYLEFSSGKKKYEVVPEISRNKRGQLLITSPFRKRIPYDVHLKSGDEYIVTYTVEVKKRKN